MDTKQRILDKCTELARMLIAKNEAYGNSALEPIGVFAKGSAAVLICTRIDDKLKRIKNGNANALGEDSIKDLLGYLILLQLALEDEKG